MNVNFDPKRLPTAAEASAAARTLRDRAEHGPDSDSTEWFAHHVLRAFAAGELVPKAEPTKQSPVASVVCLGLFNTPTIQWNSDPRELVGRDLYAGPGREVGQ